MSRIHNTTGLFRALAAANPTHCSIGTDGQMVHRPSQLYNQLTTPVFCVGNLRFQCSKR